MNPKVSILIPVYNGANFIKQSIESAINQTYSNIEIIVINDGSNDNGKTAEIVKSFGNKVKYIEKENGGVASALNLGIKEAKGEYISWLSHDDVYFPYKVEKEIDILNKLENKNTLIFSNFEIINEKGITFITTNYANNIKKETLCQDIYPVIKGCINGCTMLISKKCFEKVGYFNESLRTTNDYEMWIRLFKAFPSYFMDEPLIKYRHHANQDTRKSPVFVAESNELWKDIINSLNEEQIEKWGMDKFNVYMMLYIQMKNSNFMEAAEVAYNRAKMVYEKQKPIITIAMPCYNSKKYVGKAIESMLEQTFCNFELLIVNDSSTDNTMKIIQKYSEKDFRIKVLKNDDEKGISGVLNTAIRNAKGKYFTRINNDDISVPDRLEKQYNFLEKEENYGGCSVNIAMLDKYGTIYNENIYPEQNIPAEWTFLWTNPIPNAPCMFRMNLIKENNIEFSNLKTIEDYDFLRKIITKTKIHMLKETLYYCRQTKNNIFNKKHKETLKNSLKISEDYYKEITKSNVADYYKFLTYFYTKEDEKKIVKIEEIYEFLQKTAEALFKYYNWTDKQYEEVKKDIIRIIERYSVYKYLAQKYGNIGANFKVKKDKKNTRIHRLVNRGKEYLKKNGMKKTILKVITKVKGKIWKKA